MHRVRLRVDDMPSLRQATARRGVVETSYPARIDSFHERAFIVTFRDVPEAVTAGTSREEALHRANGVLREALDGYVQLGRQLPTPSAPEPGEALIAMAQRSSAA